MLRDVLTRLPGVATWPCDEINYIWRHGNLRYPSDVLPAELASRSVRHYIRRQFEWVQRRYNAHTVVEKTCANSLRVPFVDRVIPEARYLFICRDGLDVVGSAMQRWQAPLDLPYLVRKARFVPKTDLPYYAGRYLFSRFYRLMSKEGRVAFWGPRLDNMQHLLNTHTLEAICAIQWQRCMAAAVDAFSHLSRERCLDIRYEDFVREPVDGLSKILEFLRLDVPLALQRQAVAQVTADSVGKGRRKLSADTVEHIGTLLADAPVQKYLNVGSTL